MPSRAVINFFERNLPRLSVDIDLVFLPILDRKNSLAEISTALTRIAQETRETWREARVVEAFQNKPDALRLIVSRNGVHVKIELSPVLRGTVYEPEMRSVCDKVEDEFGFAEIQVVHPADLYAGKICAALDRQHPRVYWFSGNWSFALFELTYSSKGEFNEEEKIKSYRS